MLSEITELTENENVLKAQVDTLMREGKDRQSALEEESKLRKKLQDEITKIQKSQEEEV